MNGIRRGRCQERHGRAATAAALGLAWLLAGCGGRARAPVADGAPVPIAVVRATSSGKASRLVLPGRVKAREEVTITARITGRLTALPVREGDRFRRGDPLATFDAKETRDALASARAALASAELARDQARLQQARVESLFVARVATQREREIAEADRHAAEAAWAGAQAGAEAWSSGTRITAPFDGVVARRHVDPGVVTTPGEPLLDIRSSAVGEIEVAVPEHAVGGLAGASLSFQVGDGAWQAARLLRVDGMTDFATRTRLAHLTPARPTPLEPGDYVRVAIEAPAETARPAGGAPARDQASAMAAAAGSLRIPSACVVRRGGLTGVFVAREGRVWLRWVRLGRESEGTVEVLAGLSIDDDVALAPTGLVDGRRIEVRRR